MPVISATTEFPGWVSVNPRPVSLKTNDPQASVVATGYLNSFVQMNGQIFSNEQMVLVETTENSGASVNLGWYQISISGGNTSLVSAPGGSVQLPVVANHIATFVNTAGEIGDQAVTAIQKGSIQAGLSGTAGTLISYPSTASKGSLIVAGVANTGNTNVTISNAAMGQASVVSIPDPGNAAAQFLVGATATPFTSNHSLVASGTAGLIADAGYQMKVVAQAAVAGGAAAQTVSDAFCTSASMVVCTWNDTTNAVSIQKAVAGNGSFIVTSSGDPGASHLNYIITKV